MRRRPLIGARRGAFCVPLTLPTLAKCHAETPRGRRHPPSTAHTGPSFGGWLLRISDPSGDTGMRAHRHCLRRRAVGAHGLGALTDGRPGLRRTDGRLQAPRSSLFTQPPPPSPLEGLQHASEFSRSVAAVSRAHRHRPASNQAIVRVPTPRCRAGCVLQLSREGRFLARIPTRAHVRVPTAVHVLY